MFLGGFEVVRRSYSRSTGGKIGGGPLPYETIKSVTPLDSEGSGERDRFL